MKLRIEHQGRCVMVIDVENLTVEERGLVAKIAEFHCVIRAGSAECNAEFVAFWAPGNRFMSGEHK